MSFDLYSSIIIIDNSKNISKGKAHVSSIKYFNSSELGVLSIWGRLIPKPVVLFAKIKKYDFSQDHDLVPSYS